jgi:DnaK suppressor protein
VDGELTRLRDEARAQAEQLERDLHGLFEAARASNADDEHDPEGNTIGYERAQLTAVLEATRRRIADFDDALARVAAGEYGICETCGRPIPAERLAARPASRMCVACA